MTMLETAAAAKSRTRRGGLRRVPAAAGADGGLVLPEEVVAELAGQLAERARAGGPVALTGPGGLLSGIIGQVLQAGLAAELDARLDGGDGGEPAQRLERQDAEHRGGAGAGGGAAGPGRDVRPGAGAEAGDAVRRAERGDHQLYAKGMSCGTSPGTCGRRRGWTCRTTRSRG